MSLFYIFRTLNKVVVTGSGLSVLKHALKADAAVAGKPLVRIAMASVNAHERGKLYKNRLIATAHGGVLVAAAHGEGRRLKFATP